MKLEKEYIVSFILDRASELTKTSREQLFGDTPLASIGVDSLYAVLICGRLEDHFGIEIEPIVMFEYRTANEVADALLKMAQPV
ncbi:MULTISPECIES: acyl carrier protein [unclassified Hahella]|uniref:acyl carrier protein n=1 Tax=unclassified Hahella TaxID=2624107 RepID=UPI001C1EC0CB|nr:MULTISPECIES: acyl carrier protein [unclassified Hahella]MBU6951297.1 acyl carrier protein [Hahella sp. HN01]MDG9670568.1 acyl carrier protein [Hahella sp. CR1]WLQ16132.1 acyl carrier protein [Hahella sp. HNIBRBA332]